MQTTVSDDPTIIVPAAPAQKAAPKKIWAKLALAVALIVLGGSAGGLGLIVVAAKDLPQLRTLDDYRPPQASVVYGKDGQVVARFAKERRTVVPYERIPKIMVQSVIASEDANFFEHEGVAYFGIARCVVKNLLAGRKKCGGSTITQQTVKTFFLTPEKTYTRKIRELILAKRVEDALSKSEILYLYLNQIYFGHGAHGIQEAAKVYFGKDVSDINVEEAALLAGLPQQPTRLDPYRNPEKARKRRAYVLGRLHELGKIDEATYKAALDSPIELAWSRAEQDLDNNNHFVAHVRKILEETPGVGEKLLMEGGLRVYTGMDPKVQTAAEESLRKGLRALDKRQGYRGAPLHLETNSARSLVAELSKRREKILSKKKDDSKKMPVVWDLRALTRQAKNLSPKVLAKHARFPRLQLNKVYGGLVKTIDDAAKKALVDLGGGVTVELPLRTAMAWARKFNIHRRTSRPRKPSQVLKVGDIVLVRPTNLKKARKKQPEPAPHTYVGLLEQDPLVQASTVVIDPSTREVRGMVGGFGQGAGTFNRAVQARRQPGSTFKPIVYAAAFQTQKFTPVTPCLDAPRVYRDKWTGKAWKPKNYGGRFDGEISLRTALTKSKNLCSVELIDKIGVDAVQNMAKQVGIRSQLPRNLTLALGSGDITPLEMVNAYATLASGGDRAQPIFITKVLNPDDEVLVENSLRVEGSVNSAVIYQVTSMMQSVVEEGTAQRVKKLARPVAGKTGTTNQSRNAWFIGFTPDLVAGTWVGFDNNDPLGPGETGGRAAIPIWLGTMEKALEDVPPHEFVAPAGIVFALVDPRTGKLATPDQEGARTEPFLPGTEPTEFLESNRPIDDRGLLEDF